jgi:hypothetical protein
MSAPGTWQYRPSFPVIRAPFTAAQVAALNAWQDGPGHPFTCGNDDCPGLAQGRGGRAALTAAEDGWHCPACDYAQDWAQAFVAQAAHQPWCGDASLSRPVNECTCAITPEMQRAGSDSRPASMLAPVDFYDGPEAGLTVRHRPRRGDDVEAWLKRWRDEMDPGSEAVSILDGMLDDYRLRADTGTLLDAEVPDEQG